MANGRAVDLEDPDNSRRNEARSLDRDPIRELHQGPRSDAPHREAGHTRWCMDTQANQLYQCVSALAMFL